MQSTGWMKGLADETRLRTFRTLAEAGVGLCVAEMADVLRKPQYAVSRSFIELRKSGLVQEDRRGKFVFYSLSEDPAVAELGAWALRHCRCDDGPACGYDEERLTWRLSLRQDGKIVTQPQTGSDGKPRVLFVCVHNSARSQLAEETLRRLAGDRFAVESAGLEAGTLNPYVVAHLAAQGIDISRKPTQAVTDLFRQGRTYDWVVTVCSREAEKNCPVFPGPVRRLSWPFADPAGFTGSPDEVRAQVAALAAQIQSQVEDFVRNQNP